MDNDTDSDIANFCAVTSATSQVARDYLKVADNNLETAITLYLENGGKTLTSAAQEAAGPSYPATFSIDNITENNSPNDALISDEVLARQLQQQEESRRRSPQQQSDEVRAPIAPRTEILTGGVGGDGLLFDTSMGYGTGNMDGLWGHGDRHHQQQQQNNSISSIFNQGDSSSMENTPINLVRSAAIATAAASGSTSNSSSRSSSRHSPSSFLLTETHDDDVPHFPSPAGGSNTSGGRAKRLADLFRPPFDIMYRGGFEEARMAAREQKKWLMVNVQDPTEFACQALNRDLWSDGFVKDIVRESFVFLQYANETADGKRYLTLYPIIHYPHVAIIDSRTGERVKVWEKQLVPIEFMMEVTEFLEQHSSETIKPTTMNKSKKFKSHNQLSDMSEEEQLNAAIAASLNPPEDENASINSTIGSPSADEKEEINSNISLDDDDDRNHNETTAPSALASILPVQRKETTDMENSTRIQFRMADGSRIIRRFLKSDPVRYLFEFIKSQVPETQDQAFELVFNRQQLIDILDQQIQTAGLQNAAVNVQFA